MKTEKKCHNCKGTGKVESKNKTSDCYYCRGKGYRNQHYGVDRVE